MGPERFYSYALKNLKRSKKTIEEVMSFGGGEGDVSRKDKYHLLFEELFLFENKATFFDK